MIDPSFGIAADLLDPAGADVGFWSPCAMIDPRVWYPRFVVERGEDGYPVARLTSTLADTPTGRAILGVGEWYEVGAIMRAHMPEPRYGGGQEYRRTKPWYR